MQAYWPLYPMNNLTDIKSIITHSLKIQLGLAIKILRNKRNESATSYGPLCLSVSVCHKSEFYRNNVTHRAVFGTRASFDLHYKEIRVSSKIKALPSGTLENFATAKSMVY